MAVLNRRTTTTTIGLAALLLGAAPAEAQERRNVDFYQGPVISSLRAVGLGGALTGVAEGADSHLINPASFAVRSSHAADDWFDWDVTLSTFILDARSDTDIDLSGRSGFDSAEYGQLGFNLKFGHHGFGLQARGHTYRLQSGTDRSVTYAQTLGGVGYAYALGDGGLTFGGMLTFGNARMTEGPDTLLEIEGSGVQLGALWSPCGRPFRLGGSFRSEILAFSPDEETVTFQGDEIAYQLVIPAQLSVGYSYMLGPRPYNVCPTFGNRELHFPKRHLPRFYVLLTGDLVFTGPVENGTGAQAFLAGEEQRSGEDASASFRGGVESEVMDNRLVLRAGTYLEPSRFDAEDGRLHLTGGFDVRIFKWLLDWELCGAFDFAERYTNIGLGVGVWH